MRPVPLVHDARRRGECPRRRAAHRPSGAPLAAGTGALLTMALVAAGGWLLLGGALHAGLWALAIGLVVGEAAATALREVRSRAPR